jgi:hypothetical protein
MESWEMAGLWWLPDQPESRVVGQVRYSSDDGFRLEIPFGFLGALREGAMPIDPPPVPSVRGLLKNGKCATLFNVIRTNFSINMPGAGSEEYYAGLGYVGPAEIDADPLIDAVHVSYTFLRDWVAQRAGVAEHDPQAQSVSYHYDAPDAEEIAAKEGWTLSLIHTYGTSFPSQAGFELTHDCAFRLELAPPLDFHELQEKLLTTLWQFLSFCMNQKTSTRVLRVRRHGGDEWFDVFIHQGPMQDTQKALPRSRMLLSRPELGDRISSVLGAWLEAAEDQRRGMSLLDGLISWRGVPLDLEFLAAVQALEALARVGRSDLDMNESEFKKWLGMVLDPVKKGHGKEWAEDKLRYANRKSARELFKGLFADIGPYVGSLAKDGKRMLNEIMDNRNFYTHRDDRDKRHILEGEELFVLTQAVILLLKAAVLHLLGFSQEETSAIMEGCDGTRQWRSQVSQRYGGDELC